MMDVVVPGGVDADLDALRAWRLSESCWPNIREAFPALIELYDNTASLQDRTVGTGMLRAALGAPISAAAGLSGAPPGEPSTRAAISPTRPTTSCEFETPVLDEGDVNARRLDPHPRSRAEPPTRSTRSWTAACRENFGPRSPSAGEPREGLALVEGFRGDILVWVRMGADGARRALPPARSVVVSMAAAGSGDRGQHRRRFSDLQQILQLLLFRARSLGLDHAQNSARKPDAAAADGAGARADDPELVALAAEIKSAASARLGRSLAIRHVDAGSCNACELEIHALGNAFYDLERFGFRFVASPRHADVLLVTGPVTRNMREALQRTYDAMPAPKWVVAAGACALDGGLYAGSYACVGGVAAVIPGRPAHHGMPAQPRSTLLKGLLALMRKGGA